MKRYPQLINVSKDDGYTPLHVAAVTNHADIVGLLASHVRMSVATYPKTNKTNLVVTTNCTVFYCTAAPILSLLLL